MQFIPDTRFDVYQCCKHIGPQTFCNRFDEKNVVISVFYATGCLERDEG